jgi:hypothetical protein
MNPWPIYFLESSEGTPFTKEIQQETNGKLTSKPYPRVYNVNSKKVDIQTINDLYHAISAHSNGFALLKGIIHKNLHNESRAGSTQTQDDTTWVCFDIDGLPVQGPEDFIHSCLPPECHDVSYVHQYSSNFGIKPDYRAHIFMLLDKPLAAPQLKEWLRHLNLLNTVLATNLQLSRNLVTLKYPLDITTCQNDKLLFVSTPTFKGAQDPFTPGGNLSHLKRIELVRKTKPSFMPSMVDISKGMNDELAQAKVNELRTTKGLKKRTARFEYKAGNQVLKNPQTATVTGPTKHERGFVYLNLNNGDSYAYFHPETNPKYLYNFKGEPVYLLKDIVPDYWAQLQAQHTKHDPNLHPFVFRDFRTDVYYNALFDKSTNNVVVGRAATKDRMNDFLLQYGMALPDSIEDWDYSFDPTTLTIVDFANRRLNKFTPTTYLQQTRKPPLDIPPTIHKVIDSALGNDEETFNHFINWLAWIYQTRTKPQTAWVLQGIEGTGKGLLFHKILTPTLGPDHCRIILPEDFSDSFNDWMEHCLLLFVDEVKVERANRNIINKIKNLITDPVKRIRAMRSNPYQVPIFFGLIFATNELDALYVSETDRRFNIAPRQEKKLLINSDEVDRIETELADFTAYMLHYRINEEAVRTPLENAAKNIFRRHNRNSTQEFFDSLRNGDLDYFIDLTMGSAPSLQTKFQYDRCLAVVKNWATYAGQKDAPVTIGEIQAVYNYLQGTNINPNKFAKMLMHHRINKITLNLSTTDLSLKNLSSTRTSGIYVSWQASAPALQEIGTKTTEIA